MRQATALALAFALAVPLPAFAGAQLYEELAASVRAQLRGSIADKAPAVLQFRSSEDQHRWLNEMTGRLAKRIPDRRQRVELLKTVHHEATRAGLHPPPVRGAGRGAGGLMS